MTIQLEETNNKGRAFINDESGQTQAEMTFSKAGATLIIIDHTEVGAALKGQGIGRKLLNHLVETVRGQGKKILPLCPYAKSVFDKDPAIRDVLQ